MDALQRYSAKLVAEGIALSGRCALLVMDDAIRGQGDDALQTWGRAVLERLGATALALAVPALAVDRFLLDRLPIGVDRIVPRDTETRTFLHDIPVVRRRGGSVDPAVVASLLGSRRGVLVEGVGLVASGAYTVEQAYVNLSSLYHAVCVKFLLDALVTGPSGPAEEDFFASFRDAALAEPTAAGLTFRPGPLVEPAEILAEMAAVGRYTVERRLVDSAFGNISCIVDDAIYISQTAASLDDLDGCIDPIPFDNSTTLGLTASSELAAHRRIYEVTGARTILHGHPRSAVVLSMLCPEQATCSVADCWRDCPQVRDLGGVPVVAGEVGAGGLARRVPPVIGEPGRAIVYGHGVFAIGRSGFAEPFAALVATERWCRQEYFRRLAAGRPYG